MYLETAGITPPLFSSGENMAKRKIGLDVGDKTIGIAVSDELWITAQGLMTYERIGIKKDTDKIFGY